MDAPAAGLAEALRYERELERASSDIVRRRIGIAIGMSVAVHLTGLTSLTVGEMFGAGSTDRIPLTARLVRFEPLAAGPVATVPPQSRSIRRESRPRFAEGINGALPAAHEPTRRPIEERATPPSEEAAVAPVVAEASPPPAPEAAPPPAPEPAPPVPVPPAAEQVPQPPPAMANTEAPIKFPQRIDLEYNVSKGAGGGLIGRVQHRFERDGGKYTIRSTTVPVGIGALFGSGSFVMESRGAITSTGLRPDRFAVQRGRADRTEAVDFDWSSAKAVVSAGSETRELTLRPGAQDLLSILHQLSFMVGDANPPLIAVTTARRFDFVRVQATDKAMIQTELGPIPALHVRNLAAENALRMEVWLAPDYGYVPVKIIIRDNRGEEVEQVLARMQVR